MQRRAGLIHLLTTAFLICALQSPIQSHAMDPAKDPAPAPDTLTLTNGEQLSGKLVKAPSGSITFHSDILGDVTVPLAKVKVLHAGKFAVIRKNEHGARKQSMNQIPVGTIEIQNDTLHVSTASGDQTIPAKDVSDLVDAASFNREFQGDREFFYGWAGSITLGASLVESTNSAQTYTGATTLVRAIPAATALSPVSKTTLNLSGTYGLAQNPQIVSAGTVIQTASTIKTDILHGNVEYDKYWSNAVFGFVNASADHNYGSGLQLQQSDGGGIGWTVVKSAKNEFDLKAEMQYEQQQFYNGASSQFDTPSLNLASGAFTESWQRNFAHNMKLNESITATPAFNIANAYSAVGNAAVLFPAYKKLNFSLSTIDNYLGDPPQGYERNTFQLTAGVTYVVK